MRDMLPSSKRAGHSPFKAKIRVRVPLGVPKEQLKFKIKCIYKFYSGLTVSSAKAETGDKLVTC